MKLVGMSFFQITRSPMPSTRFPPKIPVYALHSGPLLHAIPSASTCRYKKGNDPRKAFNPDGFRYP